MGDDGVMTQNLAATLDPVDPAVRAAASQLATTIDPTSEVGRVVRSLLNEVAHGERVVVLRADDEVSPAAAADMLGVTRQFVDRLLTDEVLPFRRLPGSRHRRIRVQDVIAVGVERNSRRAGHDALRSTMEDVGLLDEA
jgi:excisionase family DNA binding protein